MTVLRDDVEMAVREQLGMEDDEEIVVTNWDEDIFEVEGQGEFLIVTEERAMDLAEDYIRDSLWAFNPSFLANTLGMDRRVFEEIVENGRCEDNNDTITRLVESEDDGMMRVVNRAIRVDGLGHFLSSYDGEEIVVEVEDSPWYYAMFRIN